MSEGRERVISEFIRGGSGGGWSFGSDSGDIRIIRRKWERVGIMERVGKVRGLNRGEGVRDIVGIGCWINRVMEFVCVEWGEVVISVLEKEEGRIVMVLVGEWCER